MLGACNGRNDRLFLLREHARYAVTLRIARAQVPQVHLGHSPQVEEDVHSKTVERGSKLSGELLQMFCEV